MNAFNAIRTGWKHLFFASWSRLQERQKVVVSDLMVCGQLLEGPLPIQAAMKANERREDLLRKVREEEQERAATELINAQNWLKAAQFDQEDELDDLLKRCHEGSCDWIHDHPKIKSWIRQGHDYTVLWLKGMPGSGKMSCKTANGDFLLNELIQEKVYCAQN